MNDAAEIGLRAWTGEKLVYFNLGNIYGYEGEISGVLLPDGETVLNNESGYQRSAEGSLNPNLIIDQRTGWPDSSGFLIYQRDIVAVGGVLYLVVWIAFPGCWGFQRSLSGTSEIPTKEMLLNMRHHGNIHEDPELIPA